MSEHCPRIIEPERKIASMNKTSIKYEHCTICDRKVEEIEMALHFCGSEQQINCAYCPEILTSTKQLVEHLKSHNDNIKIFKCSKCSKSFSMKILMEYHQRSHKENEKRPASAEISAKYMSANHSNTGSLSWIPPFSQYQIILIVPKSIIHDFVHSSNWKQVVRTMWCDTIFSKKSSRSHTNTSRSNH